MDIMHALWRRRWLVVTLVVVCMSVVFVVSRLSPKVYEATATIVTPKEVPGSGVLGGLAVSGLLQSTPGLAIGAMPSFTPNRDLLIGVLKSRTIAQAIVERFDLRTRYRAKYLDETIARLRAATTIAVSREGVISIRVEDWDPATSAAIAIARPPAASISSATRAAFSGRDR